MIGYYYYFSVCVFHLVSAFPVFCTGIFCLFFCIFLHGWYARQCLPCYHKYRQSSSKGRPSYCHASESFQGLTPGTFHPGAHFWCRLDLTPNGKVQEAGSNPACSICVHVRDTCTAKAGGPVSPPTQKTLGRRPDKIRRQTSCEVVLLTRGVFFYFTIIRRGIICSLQLQSSSASSLLSSLL